MSKAEKHAEYLRKDGDVKLFAADGLEDARKDGWKEPGKRPNGESYNDEASASARDAQADAAVLVDKEAAKEAKKK